MIRYKVSQISMPSINSLLQNTRSNILFFLVGKLTNCWRNNESTNGQKIWEIKQSPGWDQDIVVRLKSANIIMFGSGDTNLNITAFIFRITSSNWGPLQDGCPYRRITISSGWINLIISKSQTELE